MTNISAQSPSQEISEREMTRLISLGDQCKFEGQYQIAANHYLQALEIACERQAHLTRASILSRLGDTLIYTGQYRIAIEFYNQQLRIANNFGNALAQASALHKLGFGNYYTKSYNVSTDLQGQCLRGRFKSFKGSNLSYPSDHDTDHRQINKCLGCLWQ